MAESGVGPLIQQARALLKRLEAWLPPEPARPDWSALAYRWQTTRHGGRLHPIHHPHQVPLHQLWGIESQKTQLLRNTRQFLQGLPANNVLLWGARGTGKSSLIKAMLTELGGRGLRMVEVERERLQDLSEILEALRGRRERFIVYCDDLAFAAQEPGYRALKAVIEGGLSAPPENVLLYASSNRRHLLAEQMADNLAANPAQAEIHPGEALEEKISLAERFGLRLAFYPFDQTTYLEVVGAWLAHYHYASPESAWRQAALQWATQAGGRSGRVAHQFARDRVGQARLSNT